MTSTKTHQGAATDDDDAPEDDETTDPIVGHGSYSDIYARAALLYRAAGWRGVLPLPPGLKYPVPQGYTGNDGVDPSYADITAWCEDRPGANIALRMPPNVLGVDIDQYDAKRGADEFDRLERELGPLPATWRTTSRDDGRSGIRLYKVPPGLRWPGILAPGIETVRREHRYAVVWPSTHPEGRTYRWIGPDGNDFEGIPGVDELPELPSAWIERFTRGERATSHSKAHLSDSQTGAWLDAHNGTGEPCARVSGALSRALAAFGHGSRHEWALDATNRLAYLAAEGHQGVVGALDELRQTFVEAVSAERADAASEWDRAITGAVKLAVAELGDAPSGSCLARVVDGCGLLPGTKSIARQADPHAYPFDDPAEGADPETIWQATPTLARLRNYADATRVAPWGLLACTLSRVVAHTEPTLRVDTGEKSPLSLNSVTCLLAGPGEGKTTAMSVARDFLAVRPSIAGPPKTGGLGSGEGLLAAFQPDDKDGPTPTRVLIVVDEAGAMLKVAKRNGNNVLDHLRTAWYAESIQSGYADRAKNRGLGSHAYRLAVVIGAQPSTAQPLIDEAAEGTPQRILWIPSDGVRRYAKRSDVPAKPAGLDWSIRLWPTLRADRERHMTMCERALDDVFKAGSTPKRELDGHAIVVRVKVAASLALLDGRADHITEQDWQLSGLVMSMSNRTREAVVKTAHATAQAANRARGIAEGERRAAADEAHAAATDDTAERVRGRVLDKLAEAGAQGIGRGQLRNAFKSSERRAFDDVIGEMLADGDAEEFAYRPASGPRAKRLRLTLAS